VVALHRDQPVDEGILIYLNRLSDLLFTLARDANRRAGIADIPWQPNKP
jgi:cob(I)alamin adenosyltransferase